jgi:hypothetical protein
MPTPWFRRCVTQTTRTIRKVRPTRKPATLLSCLQLEDRTVPAAWHDLSALVVSPTNAPAYIHPDHYRPFAIDMTALRSELAAAPMEFTSGTPLVVTLPRPDGTTERFAVHNSPIMEPALAAQFPEIQTYSGQGIDNPADTARFDVNDLGFHAQVLSSDGEWFIDPYYLLETQTYISYFGGDLNAHSIYETRGGVQTGGVRPPMNLDAGPDPDPAPSSTSPKGPAVGGTAGGTAGGTGVGSGVTLPKNGTELRTYRLAVAADGEYSQFFGDTVPNSLSAITTTVNRVVGVYMTELSIKMVLIANESSLIYLDPATDPYTNNNPGQLLTENQTNVDSVIGTANYDIGHVFTTAGGGLAGLGVVGNPNRKAQGETGLSNPVGDGYDIDYVAHEMGHEFGANHPFDGVNGSAAGNANPSTAFEPGSGSTIMAYAGICGSDDLQPHSDPYFHSVNIDEIVNYVDNVIPTVGTRTPTGNGIPTVNAGADAVIPANTPFALTATGSDSDGDPLTFNWEERDLGPLVALGAADNGQSPRFRVYSPTSSPTQTFPRLKDLVNNTLSPGDQLFTTARTSHFRVTARDNLATGGGSDFDDVQLTVVNTGAPFQVTAPNTSGISWQGLSTQTVTWNVAGTTGNGINVANVRILFSTDGGFTYPITVLASTPNNGSAQILAPNVNTTQGRIRVEAIGSVFFDISDKNISTTQVAQATATIVKDPTQLDPTNTGPIRFDVTFSEPVTGFTGTDIQFAPGTINTGLSAVVTPNGPAGDQYFVDVSGMDGAGTVGIAIPGGAVSSIATGAPNVPITIAPGELVNFDNVPPTTTVTPSSIGLTNQPDTTITVTFSKPVTGFTAGSLVPTNASVQNFTVVSQTQYAFTLHVPSDGPFSLTVPDGATTDAVGNPNTAATVTGTLDATPPTATITRVSPATITAEPAVFEVSFSESIVPGSFTAADVLFTGSTTSGTLVAQVTPVSGSPNDFMVSVTGMTSVGTIRISIGPGAVADIAGNFNTDPAVADSDVQLVGTTPTVTLSTTATFPSNATSVPVTAVFSIKVTGFTASDLLVTNGSVSNFQAQSDGKTFTFDLHPAADGPFNLTLPAAAAFSNLGVPNDPASLSGSFDTTPPQASINVTATFPTMLPVVPVTVHFSEPVTGFTATDPVVTGPASVSNFQAAADGQTFTFDITRTGDGSFTLTIPAAAASDAAGNASLPAGITGSFDTTGPIPTLSTTTTFPTNAAEVPVKVHFPEPVTGFTATDLVVTNGGVTQFLAGGDGQTFTFSVARGADGPFSVSIGAGAATDLAGNPSAAASLSGTFDATAPTATLTTPTTFPTNQTAVPVTVTFSEPVTGFDQTDLVVINGTVTNFVPAGDGLTFTLTLTRTTDGTFDLTLPAGAAADAAGNPSGAAHLAGSFDTVGATATITPQSSAFFGTAATFIVSFDQAPVSPLTAAAVQLGGTALPTAVSVAQGLNSRTFVLTVTGMTQAGTVTASVLPGAVSDVAGNPSAASDTAVALFNPQPVTPPAPQPDPGLRGARQFAIGAGEGSSPLVTLAGPDGRTLFQRPAFDPAFLGGVRTAAADLNGDGIAEAIVGTGPGGVTRVRVLDGATGAELFAVQPFEAAFTGGIYVTAGDLTGDGVPDIVVTADEGGGPRVLIYDGKSFQLVSNFFGISDTNFRGGARAAVGDVNGDGRADLVVAAGFGGGPRVAVYDGKTVVGGPTPTRLFNDIFVFEQTLRNGVFVSVGDVDGDGFGDLVVGGGPGGGPRVTIFSGRGLVAGQLASPPEIANFFAGDQGNRGGVRVAVKDLDGDAKADVVVGDGEGAGSRVTAYLGSVLTSGSVTADFAFDAFPGSTSGVYVG